MRLKYSEVSYCMLRLSDIRTGMFYWRPFFVSEDAGGVVLGESLRIGLKSNSEFYLGGSVLGSVALGGHFI